jgi:predicted DNA-binding transcriptional regulator YafY
MLRPAHPTKLIGESRLSDRVVGAPSDSGALDPDGWVRAQVPFESVDDAIQTFRAISAEIEVLSPNEIRDGLADTAQIALSRYRRHIQ